MQDDVSFMYKNWCRRKALLRTGRVHKEPNTYTRKVHACIHAYMHTCIHKKPQTRISTYMYINTYIHTYADASLLSDRLTAAHSRSQAVRAPYCVYVCMRVYVGEYLYVCTCMCEFVLCICCVCTDACVCELCMYVYVCMCMCMHVSEYLKYVRIYGHNHIHTLSHTYTHIHTCCLQHAGGWRAFRHTYTLSYLHTHHIHTHSHT